MPSFHLSFHPELSLKRSFQKFKSIAGISRLMYSVTLYLHGVDTGHRDMGHLYDMGIYLKGKMPHFAAIHEVD